MAPSKARGQNFLSDPNLIAKLAGLILERLNKSPLLLEIGPGLGALTRPLLASGVRLVAVEYDQGLAGYLARELGPAHPEFQVLAQDVLTVSLPALAVRAGGPLLVAGNLPYNLTTPILFWLLANRHLTSGAVFMVQKEVARRLTAPPGHKDYGRLSVALSLTAKVKTLMQAPPGAFHPRPRVESTVVGLNFPPEAKPGLDLQAFGRFTQAAFAARRKTIINNLGAAFGRHPALEALERTGIAPDRRPETITPEDFYRLWKLLARHSNYG